MDTPFPTHLEMNYSAPVWLPGGHLQTIWSALWARRYLGPRPEFRRERWNTPDQDFIDVDFLNDGATVVSEVKEQRPDRPLLVLFHGLEGSSRSQYAQAFAGFARSHNWAYAVPHFRGCSGELNLAPRAYHSGDYQEYDWILKRFRRRHQGPVIAVGISMGGNALLRWAQESGEAAASTVQSVAAICSPIDLAAGGWAIGRGFNRQVYNRMFLGTMKPKALLKLKQFPGLFDAVAMRKASDLYEFDNIFTAPLHGFKSTEDYWARASAKPHLDRIKIPALVVNARNDPFVPAWSLPHKNEVGPCVTLWQPAGGGHVGFPRGHWPGHVRTMPEAVGQWFKRQVGGL
jgi:predicted alpha/beta-fold hydrolase